MLGLHSFCLALFIEFVYERSIDVYRLSQLVDFIYCHLQPTESALDCSHTVGTIELYFDGGVTTLRTRVDIWNTLLRSSTHLLPSSSTHIESPFAYFTQTADGPRKKQSGLCDASFHLSIMLGQLSLTEINDLNAERSELNKSYTQKLSYLSVSP